MSSCQGSSTPTWGKQTPSAHCWQKTSRDKPLHRRSRCSHLPSSPLCRPPIWIQKPVRCDGTWVRVGPWVSENRCSEDRQQVCLHGKYTIHSHQPLWKSYFSTLTCRRSGQQWVRPQHHQALTFMLGWSKVGSPTQSTSEPYLPHPSQLSWLQAASWGRGGSRSGVALGRDAQTCTCLSLTLLNYFLSWSAAFVTLSHRWGPSSSHSAVTELSRGMFSASLSPSLTLEQGAVARWGRKRSYILTVTE